MRKTLTKSERYEYKGQGLTVAQILKIKGWPWSEKQTYIRLRSGSRVKDLIPPPSTEYAREIMKVPVNPKYTQEYYIMQQFTPRAESNLSAANQETR